MHDDEYEYALYYDNYDNWPWQILRDRQLMKESMNPQTAASTNPADFKGKFLIGSINKTTGAVSFSINPARQPSHEAAKKEAARLAKLDQNKHFMVVEVKDIATFSEISWA